MPNSYDTKKEKDLKIYEALEADKVINAYGVFGRYQLFGYCLCQCLNFFYASSVYVMPYIQLNPTLLCMYQNKSIAVDDSCWITERNLSLIGQCGVINGTRLIIIDSTPVTSLIKEFELTCGKYIWKEAGLSIFTIGAVLTVPFMSNLADQYGRKPIVLTAIFVAFLANVASTFAPSFWIFLALRFIVGAASDTYASVCGILTCELISSKCRAWITLVYTLAWTCGMFWVGCLSLFITKWRMMYLINSAPGIFGVVYYFLLPESPHWLIQHKKTIEIQKYITTSNRWNNTTINLHECQRVAEREVSGQQTARDLCGSRAMLKYLCINGFIQFVMSLYYFALSFMSIDLSKDRFTAYMLSAFIEIPGGLIVIPLMIYFGRRCLTITSLSIQALAIGSAPFLNDSGWTRMTALLFGKFINSVTYGVHPIYASEMVPTSVRSLSFSIINIPQSIGIIVAPYFSHIEIGPDWSRFVGVAACCVLAAGLTCFLPETKDCDMPTDIQSLVHEGMISGEVDGRQMLMRVTQESSSIVARNSPNKNNS